MKRLFITGGAGFIGSNLVDYYLENGWDVLVYDNFSTGKKSFCNSGAIVVEGDISDKVSLGKAIRDFSPDCISHHAAHVSVRNSFSEPYFNAEKNILGSINIFSLAGENGVKQVVFASTGGVMLERSNSEFPVSVQEGNLELDSPYALSKFCAEKYLRYFAQKYNYTSTILRYANIYGPRQTPNSEAGVIAIFIEKMLQKRAVSIYGDGTQTRDFLYIEDVVRAHFLATEKKISGTFNVSSGEEVSVNEIYNALSQNLGYTQQPEMKAFDFEELPRSCLDYTKFSKATDWKPQNSFDQGLKKTLIWNRDYYQSIG